MFFLICGFLKIVSLKQSVALKMLTVIYNLHELDIDLLFQAYITIRLTDYLTL